MTDTLTPMKLRIAVLFGGRSAEHDVSVRSATNVMRALQPGRYDAVPVFVTREGMWLLSSFEDGTLSTPAERDAALPRARRTRADDRDSGRRHRL